MNEIIITGATKNLNHVPEGIRVSKKCPACGLRVFDKITAASGIVEVKCHRCGTLYYLNLSFRTAARRSSCAFSYTKAI